MSDRALIRTFDFREAIGPDHPNSPFVGKPVRLKAGLEWECEEGNTTGWVCVQHRPPFVFLVPEGSRGTVTARVTNEKWVELT